MDELTIEGRLACGPDGDEAGSRKLKAMLEDGLARLGQLLKTDADAFWMTEAGLAELADFAAHHLEAGQVRVRIGSGPWLSLEEAGTIADAEWIDGIIRSGSIEPYAQPIVTAEGERYGYELLARFRRTDGTLVLPGEAFAAARLRGRLYALDRACRMAAVRRAAVLGTRAFINFLPTSIYSPEFCLRSTMQLAERLGADPSLLVFEVVETERVDDPEHLKSILAYYRERGFRTALDDTGAGFSDEGLLKQLAPNYMKLDRGWAHGVAARADKQEAALRFLRLAREIGAVPLAEGIEEQADYDWLRERGYELFQGYLFGRPAPVPAPDGGSAPAAALPAGESSSTALAG